MKLIASIILILFVLAGCGSVPKQNDGGTITYTRTVTVTVPTTQPADHVVDANRMVITERIEIVQPSNPASGASLTTADGTSASVPASYTPAAPAGPTPTARALGGLVWLGAGLFIAGMLGLGLRMFVPWMPVGASVMVCGSGLFLIAYSQWLADAPWWLNGLCIAIVIAAGLAVAVRDNIVKLFRRPE